MKERKRPPKSLVTQLDEALARFIQIDPKEVADKIEKMRREREDERTDRSVEQRQESIRQGAVDGKHFRL